MKKLPGPRNFPIESGSSHGTSTLPRSPITFFDKQTFRITNISEFERFKKLDIALFHRCVSTTMAHIQLKTNKHNKKKYDFIEAADNDSKIDGLPKGLSIENNHDEQQIDLAYTYYEMGNYEDAVKILNQIIKNSKITSIKTKAEELLAMIQK